MEPTPRRTAHEMRSARASAVASIRRRSACVRTQLGLGSLTPVFGALAASDSYRSSSGGASCVTAIGISPLDRDGLEADRAVETVARIYVLDPNGPLTINGCL